MTEQQSNLPMRYCHYETDLQDITERQRVKVSYSVNTPFDFCLVFRQGSDILSVILPTFNDVVFLSPETEVCPSLYRNLGRRDQMPNDHIKAHIWLERATKKHSIDQTGPADLVVSSHREERRNA
jgi:hypothetical protein